MTTGPFDGPLMGDFPGRPNHPDFWVLVDVVLQQDGKTEDPTFDMGAHLATVIDPKSLMYVAEQRSARLVNQPMTRNVPPEVTIGAAWLDAFMAGVMYAKRKAQS